MAEREPGAQIWGREAEAGTLRDFVGAAGAFPGALVVSGPPGIGKTTLWEAAVASSRAERLCVLAARASEAEARLAFAVLIDLLDRVDVRGMSRLPAPQVAALEAALRRTDPGSAPEPGALGLGLLNVLRQLAAAAPLLVAIDDVHVLDGPSADALAFAARRLGSEPVGFLLTRRPDEPYALEQPLRGRGPRELAIGPLSVGAIRRLLAERLGLALPRPLLRRLTDATLGNPLFALEVGRELLDRGLPSFGEELPVPRAVEDLLGTRVERLAVPLRRALLAVALDADLRPEQVAEVAGLDALDEALEAGLLCDDGDRVRAAHPLLAAAARTRAGPRERRELHRTLALTVADEELRARHLALATVRPDERIASLVARTAAAASARGARQEAVELGAQALRLTAAGSRERGARLLDLADFFLLAGEKDRATELLSTALDLLPAGPARARALLILTAGVIRSDDDIEQYFERPLLESRSDPDLHAALLASKATDKAFLQVSGIREAEAMLTAALPAARRAGADVEREALDSLAWLRAFRGRPIDDVCERYAALSETAQYIAASPERAEAQRLAWRGEIAAAREVLTSLLAIADERAESSSYVVLRLHLCELSLRAGDLPTAAQLLDEWAESMGPELPIPTAYRRCRALLAAARGFPGEAERWAAEASTRAKEGESRWDLLEASRALGLASLLSHEPERAAESLRSVWEHTEREGLEEPGAFPVAGDLVEALLELGELGEAQAVTTRLRALAEAQDHPWGIATAKRCEALVAIASQRDEDVAAAELDRAAAAYGELGLRFDRARTLLLLGRVQRRRRKWAGARHTLEQAAGAFDAIGSSGWAEEARSELGRVGARRPRPAGDLTKAERRVVELAADGLSNKEIARALFVTVNTVETHLSRAYAKLGVRSRAQLGRLRSG